MGKRPDTAIKTESPTAVYLTELINNNLHVQQDDLRKHLQLKDAGGNIITMFKTGRSKIPIKYIPKICEFYGVDTAKMMTLALKEYHPDILGAISDWKGESFDPEEMLLLRMFRKAKDKFNEQYHERLIQELKDEAIANGEPLKEKDMREARRQKLSLNKDSESLTNLVDAFEQFLV